MVLSDTRRTVYPVTSMFVCVYVCTFDVCSWAIAVALHHESWPTPFSPQVFSALLVGIIGCLTVADAARVLPGIFRQHHMSIGVIGLSLCYTLSLCDIISEILTASAATDKHMVFHCVRAVGKHKHVSHALGWIYLVACA